MVLKNIADVSRSVRKGVNAVKWERILSMSYVSNVIGKISFGVIILLTLNLVFGYIAKFLFSKEIARERNFNGLMKNNVHERTISVPTIYGTFFQFITFLFTIALLANFLGIEIATIVVVFVFAIIIVIALIQGTIGNIIASLLISYFQTYEMGDIIMVNGVEGQVIGFNSLNTTIDDISTTSRITIPNKTMYESLVTNYSKSPSFVYTFYIQLSNVNKDFDKILKVINDDLDDAMKYPYIYRNDKSSSVKVGVDSYDSMGTKLKVLVPFISTYDLINYKTEVKTKVRLLLAKQNIQLFDNYTYHLDK